MYFVYRFLDELGNIIYVGKSKQKLERRFKGHAHLPKQCYDLVYKIEYIECPTESDMSIKEIYYINKYRNNNIYFNTLDMTEVPISVDFDDEWMMYKGPLDSHFYKSINYTQGFEKEIKLLYKKDGTIDRRIYETERSGGASVDGLSEEDVNLIVKCIIKEINTAENDNQEQIHFRNLVVFILGVNLPEKPGIFYKIKYKDLLDENDLPKAYALTLDSRNQSEVMYFPLQETAKQILLAYVRYCDLSYAKNSEDFLFQTRKHSPLSASTFGAILKKYTQMVGINKNIGSESLKKTYGLNIYEKSKDKLNALLFLGKIWGSLREVHVINYLNLTDNELDLEYYLGGTFSLGGFKQSEINCLCRNSILEQKRVSYEQQQQKTRFRGEENIVHERVRQEKAENESSNKINRVWNMNTKLEIVGKHLVQGISQQNLAKEYNVDTAAINRWISAFKEYGESGLEDKRNKKSSKYQNNFEEDKSMRNSEMITSNHQMVDSENRFYKLLKQETKIEIVEKYIKQHISADILAKVYNVEKAIIYQWVREYTRYGREAFSDFDDIQK